MNYRIGIAKRRRGSVEATVFDLPGCRVEARDMSALATLLPVAVAEHVAWLEGHREPLSGAWPVETETVEEVAVASTAAADGEFCFEDDSRPMSGDELETAVRHLGYARTSLRARIDGLPDDVLDWRPPAAAMARIDPWNPEVLTIREIVAEIAGSEAYYRRGLEDGKQEDEPLAPERDDIELQRGRLIERLRALSQDERSRVYYPTRSWQEKPERWTARKVIRRAISHERFHTKEIEQRLAWLLLGLPDFTATRAPAEGVATHG